LILQDFLTLEMRRYSSTAIPDSNLSDIAPLRSLSVDKEWQSDFSGQLGAGRN
jgi:hypothetical protein